MGDVGRSGDFGRFWATAGGAWAILLVDWRFQRSQPKQQACRFVEMVSILFISHYLSLCQEKLFPPRRSLLIGAPRAEKVGRVQRNPAAGGQDGGVSPSGTTRRRKCRGGPSRSRCVGPCETRATGASSPSA